METSTNTCKNLHNLLTSSTCTGSIRGVIRETCGRKQRKRIEGHVTCWEAPAAFDGTRKSAIPSQVRPVLLLFGWGDKTRTPCSKFVFLKAKLVNCTSIRTGVKTSTEFQLNGRCHFCTFQVGDLGFKSSDSTGMQHLGQLATT